MRYAGLNKNDMINGKGVCVSVWLQGCPHKCSGCHNPETWDPQGGTEINRDVLIEKIKKAITANGIIRNVSILGGEPLAPYNIDDLLYILKEIKEFSPTSLIYLWTGYIVANFDEKQKQVWDYVDLIVDGPYIEALRDITLPLRGSSNQTIAIKEK